jgi:hypothetical protein
MLTFAIKMSSLLTPSFPEPNFLTPEELELVLSSGELDKETFTKEFIGRVHQ